jgi:predicted O-methyltransferase YrrM
MNNFWKNYRAARDFHSERRFAESIVLAEASLANAGSPSELAMGHWLLYANKARQGRHDDAIGHLETALDLETETEQRLRLQCALVGQYRHQGRLKDAKRIQSEVLKSMKWPGQTSPGYDFTKELWFAQNHGKFCEILLALASRKSLISIVEIGSLQGMSACYMVDLLSDVCEFEITCIDPDFQPEFSQNVQLSRRPNSLKAIPGTSQDILRTLRPDSFDFIHIDGWHVAPQVFLDGLYAMNVCAAGAYIVFDDYLKEDQTNKGQTVQIGALAFRRLFEPHLHTEHEGRQLVCQVKSKPIDLSPVIAQTSSLLSKILGRPVSVEGSTLTEISDSVRDHFEDLLAASWKDLFEI